MRGRGAPEDVSGDRRRVLGIAGTLLLTSIPGCSTVIDFAANRALEEVNVLNQLNRDVSGTVRVIDPAGDTVLDESFEVPSTESSGESNVIAYDGVWENTGEYTVSVEFTDIELEGVSGAERTVRIDDVGEDMVGVIVGSGIESEPIAIRVGESLSEFGRTGQNNQSSLVGTTESSARIGRTRSPGTRERRD